MMLGWLAHALTTTRSSTTVHAWNISRCSVPMSGVELAARLPWLGSVLYLPPRSLLPALGQAPRGWLAARAELAPLLQVAELRGSSMIGVDGPREWIDAVDACGAFCARLHLLPDTDYLAWDALLAQARSLPSAPVYPGQLARHATRAELLRFHTRRLAAFALLDAMPPGQLSTLGRDIARAVARSAAVELMS